MKYLLLYIFVLTFTLSYSQTKSKIDSLTAINIVQNDFNSSFKHGHLFLKNVTRFEEQDLINVSIVLGGSALTFLADESVRDKLVYKKIANKGIVKYGDYYGKIITQVGLVGGLYLTGLAIDNDDIRITGKTLFEAMIASAITIGILKFTFGRARPYAEEGTTSFHWFEIENRYNSFASGHSIAAFTMSTVLSERIDNIYASIGLYGLASLTFYQRIASDNHWFSDTVLGAVLGIAIGKYFSDLNNSSTKNSLNKQVQYNLSPVFYSDYGGLNLSISF